MTSAGVFPPCSQGWFSDFRSLVYSIPWGTKLSQGALELAFQARLASKLEIHLPASWVLGLKTGGPTAQHISKGCARFWCLSFETLFLPITTAADGSIPYVLCIAPASFSAYSAQGHFWKDEYGLICVWKILG